MGIIAVSRDCFVISLSERRRKAIVESYAKKGGELYEVMTTVENENDMLKAVDEAKKRRLQRFGGIPGQLRPGNS